MFIYSIGVYINYRYDIYTRYIVAEPKYTRMWILGSDTGRVKLDSEGSLSFVLMNNLDLDLNTLGPNGLQ